MHPEAHAGFGEMLRLSGIDPNGTWRVLDVGGQNVNGTVHEWLPNSKITTLDLENADIIADATSWCPDQWFDIVIATEVFEHVQGWTDVIDTMVLALDLDGPQILIATCASLNRPEHGATGAPKPARGEWYRNVLAEDLREHLELHFIESSVVYRYPPGDAYMYAKEIS